MNRRGRVHGDKTVHTHGEAVHVFGHPLDRFQDFLVLPLKVRPVPDRFVMKNSVSQLPDLVEAGPDAAKAVDISGIITDTIVTVPGKILRKVLIGLGATTPGFFLP
jgi:hypothetical protein